MSSVMDPITAGRRALDLDERLRRIERTGHCSLWLACEKPTYGCPEAVDREHHANERGKCAYCGKKLFTPSKPIVSRHRSDTDGPTVDPVTLEPLTWWLS